MSARIGSQIVHSGGVPQAGEFPMIYTDMHDLSIVYILGEVKRQQQEEIEQIQSCVSQLDGAPAAKAIAEEALGAAQGHLDNLNGVQSVSA